MTSKPPARTVVSAMTLHAGSCRREALLEVMHGILPSPRDSFPVPTARISWPPGQIELPSGRWDLAQEALRRLPCSSRSLNRVCVRVGRQLGADLCASSGGGAHEARIPVGFPKATAERAHRTLTRGRRRSAQHGRMRALVPGLDGGVRVRFVGRGREGALVALRSRVGRRLRR